LPDWAPFEELTQRLEPIGTTGIRYLIRSIPVDLVPFGDVEDPTGSVTPTRRDEDMSVFAFREVFDHASNLRLPRIFRYGSLLRLASVPSRCQLGSTDR
jgi:predicted nucleotidyltransferase